jgi:hypothetical protein
MTHQLKASSGLAINNVIFAFLFLFFSPSPSSSSEAKIKRHEKRLRLLPSGDDDTFRRTRLEGEVRKRRRSKQESLASTAKKSLGHDWLGGDSQ